MPRGKPDYLSPRYGTSVLSFDMGGLITALRGVSSVDNKGRILFFDTFSEGLFAWYSNSVGSGIDPALTTNKVEVPPVSVQMEAGSTPPGGFSFVNCTLNMTGNSKVGFEVGLYSAPASPLYTIGIEYDNGGVAYTGTLVFDPVALTLRIISGGLSILVYTFSALPAYDGWLCLKLVVDFDTNYYDAVIYGKERLSLKQYPLGFGAIGREDTLKFSVTVNANNAVSHTGYLGHAILTTDEP
jgi:hypothetical protein